MMRLVKHRNRSPREAVKSPSVEISKSQFDKYLSRLVKTGMILPQVGAGLA